MTCGHTSLTSCRLCSQLILTAAIQRVRQLVLSPLVIIPPSGDEDESPVLQPAVPVRTHLFESSSSEGECSDDDTQDLI